MQLNCAEIFCRDTQLNPRDSGEKLIWKLERVLTYRGTFLLLSSICNKKMGKQEKKWTSCDFLLFPSLFGFFIWSLRDYWPLKAVRGHLKRQRGSFDHKNVSAHSNDYTFCLCVCVWQKINLICWQLSGTRARTCTGWENRLNFDAAGFGSVLHQRPLPKLDPTERS